MKILFATSNPGKLREVRAIFGSAGVEVVGLDVLPDPVDEPVEDGETFEANAELKAIGYTVRHGNALSRRGLGARG